MPKIKSVRSILLSSPYADPDDPEIKECFPNGAKRTIGMVEITLERGVTGLGEGYLAVFAPLVFTAIVDLCRPHVIGLDGFDIAGVVRRLRSLSDYWSLQGAARHVISAFEIALQDAKAKSLGVPVYDLLGGAKTDSVEIYGSGGCCDAKEQFLRELDLLGSNGIKLYKIRSVQRDDSVIGGIAAVMDIFEAGKNYRTGVVVDAWGGAAAIMASYHAAFAAGGTLVEFPMLAFPLGEEMIGDQGRIIDGRLLRPS